jgi:hypothetical protein
VPIRPNSALSSIVEGESEHTTAECKALRSELESLLGGGLGLDVFPTAMSRRWARLWPRSVRESAVWRGAKIFVAYLLLFCGLPWAVHLLFRTPLPPSEPLMALQVYGAFWAGWSTVTATLTADTVLGILGRDVLPGLSGDTCIRLTETLRRSYPRTRLLLQSWLIAAVAATIAGILVHPASTSRFEIVWWSAGWAILFATSANVVAVASFYRILPDALPDVLAGRLWLDPAQSKLVESIARIGRVILLFWVGIAFSIALIVPAGLDWSAPRTAWLRIMLPDAWLKETVSFVAVEVPIAGFFSIGVGVLVFLSAEAGIRAAVRMARLRSLERIDAEMGSRLDSLDRLTTEEIQRLQELRTLHSAVASTDSYRSLLISSLSVLLPFVPLLSLLFGGD